MAERILLKNGTVIIHGADDTARGVKADLLIEGDKIAQIEANLSSSAGVKVIDCTDKIIAPGFVDTHRHMYNTALRGRHGDNMLHDYVVQGILHGGSFDPSDAFWGQLASHMECINDGTTTVVDHSHMNYSEEHPKAALAATIASGLRSIYAYTFTGRVASWSPFAMNPDLIAPFALDALQELAASAPFGDGRVTLGVGFDLWFLPNDVITDLFQKIKKLGIKHITTHNSPSPPGRPTQVETIQACGILSPDTSIILSHANHLAPSDVELIKKHDLYVSSTPSVELQMGLGRPACFDPDRDVQSHSSLGIDCHNVALPSIVGEMRCALVNARGEYNAKFYAAYKMAAKVNHTVQEAYALGTIQGARAVKMEDQIGSLAVGKKADIIVFDALSPSMICGAQYDPVTAIVMHSTPGDIEMTFVDGILRKVDGKVLPVQVKPEDAKFTGIQTSSLSWAEVSKNLLKSQESVLARIDKIDLEAAREDALTSFGFPTSIIVSKL